MSFTEKIKYTLSAKSNYSLDEPIIINFKLTNFSDRSVWILVWYTPLEGLKGDILDIICDGNKIPYEGRMVKRGDPVSQEYIQLSPGESIAKDIDLSEAYRLSKCGKCMLEFKGQIRDIVQDDSLIPQKIDKHKSVEILGNSVTFSIGS